jgi:single-stranded DNA-binding protein
MINRVLIAGRLLKSPELSVTPGGTPLAVLTLELKHPSWKEGEPDVCTVQVHAYGEGLTSTLSRYLTAGRDLLVEGQLREATSGLCIALDRFQFLRDKIEARYFWDDARKEHRAA